MSPQAILLDIALIFPGILASTLGAGVPFLQVAPLSDELLGLYSTVVFVCFNILLTYSVVSSLVGATPNNIPFVSKRVEDRMPSINNFIENYRKAKQLEKENKDSKKRNNSNNSGKENDKK